MRTRTRILSTAVVCLASLAARPATAQEQDGWGPQIHLRGSSGPLEMWEEVVDGYTPPIHVTLLPDGRILYVGYVRPQPEVPTSDPAWGWGAYGSPPFAGVLTPSPLGTESPLDVWPESVPVPYDRAYWTTETIDGEEHVVFDTLFCAGQTLTSDGKVYFAGGMRIQQPSAPPLTDEYLGLGLEYATVFDPATDSWERMPGDMMGAGPGDWGPTRWYPTILRTADERIVVINGTRQFHPIPNDGFGEGMPNRTAIITDPDGSNVQLLSRNPLDDSQPDVQPTDWDSLGYPYTAVYQLPEPLPGNDGFDVIVIGNAGVPVFMSTTGRTRFHRRDNPRPGVDASRWIMNLSSTSMLLPLRLDGAQPYGNGTVMLAGADCLEIERPIADGVTGQNPLDTHVDFYDPVDDRWLPTLDMGIGRHTAASVVLPDGKILILGGYDDCIDPATPELGRAQYIDPLDDFQITLGENQATDLIRGEEAPEVHGYHSVALLLPDGRVMYGGGRYLAGTWQERSTFRYYSPPYMFQERPELVSAPDEISYGETFEVDWEGESLADAVLVGLGSMTHGHDFNTRHVQLEIHSVENGRATLVAPRLQRWAPPGHYMLFVLDEDRVPSTAQIVHLDGVGEDPGLQPTPTPETMEELGVFGAERKPPKKGCLSVVPGEPSGSRDEPLWIALAIALSLCLSRRRARSAR